MLPWLNRLRRIVRPALFLLPFFALILASVGGTFVAAQTLSPEALRALQRGADDNTRNQDTVEDNTPVKPRVEVYQPAVPDEPPPTSAIERLYSERAGRELKQVGYNQFGRSLAVTIAPGGAVQDEYILAPGDELIFTLRGQENASYRQKVDRDGRIILPKLAPIAAGGRRLGDFRADLEAQVAQAFISTRVFISLATVHQVTVMVTGEARAPGARILSALATPLDALLLSGGVNRQGSLRAIQLIRGGTVRTIDLYTVMLRGGASSIGMLRDGDRIFVPPLGQTVAVAGGVRRAGIYELAPGTSAIGVSELMRLAGGLQIAGSYNLAKAALQSSGANSLVPITQSAAIRSGEILFVDPSQNVGVDRVVVDGAVTLRSARPLASAATTSDVFRSVTDLDPEAYAVFALIVRRDARTNAVTILPFSIASSIDRSKPIALMDRDSVYVLNRREAHMLARVVSKDVNKAAFGTGGEQTDDRRPGGTAPTPSTLTPGGGSNAGTAGSTGTVPPSNNQPAASTFSPTAANRDLPAGRANALGNRDSATVAALDQAGETALRQSGTEFEEEYSRASAGPLAATLGITVDQLLRVAADNLIWVLDEVAEPGPYLAARGSSLADMIQAAGGPLQVADLSAVEITSTEIDQLAGLSRTTRSSYSAKERSFASVVLNPLDVVRLRPVFLDREKGSVAVTGEVRYPGVFSITRDERLSSVLERAGGLTEVAYPYGAIFTRKAAALAERAGNERSAREIESQAATLAVSSTTATDNKQQGLTFLTSVADQLRTQPALGRVTVVADPVVLATSPQLDPILQPGDAIFIPKRPSSVTVSGEVLNPGSFQFRSGLSFKEYLSMAGGPTQSAYTSLAFIVLPDGSARPISDSWLSFSSAGGIPPGSTIIVPRDLRPFDWGTFLKDATTIISQLAVAAASLSVLNRN